MPGVFSLRVISFVSSHYVDLLVSFPVMIFHLSSLADVRSMAEALMLFIISFIVDSVVSKMHSSEAILFSYKQVKHDCSLLRAYAVMCSI